MKEVTRLAPSPTGALHLGNARTFLVNWALARRGGWEILLRIEDLDGPRVKPEAVDGIQETLRWLGLDWDGAPLVQSADLAPYRAALERLVAGGFAYPCTLTRGQIAAAASAPQEGAHELVFPMDLRPKSWERRIGAEESNWRFVVDATPVAVEDAVHGRREFDLSRTIGDFVVWTKRASPAYQLAVVVDDARQGVTRVVRGDDLLESAARQRRLYRALGLAPEPAYAHLPLVVGPDGARLAKRHGDGRLEALRARGVRPEAVIGLLARWSGIEAKGPLSAAEFRDAFDLARLPKAPAVLRPADLETL
jgi:glutamyl-tRNA synthetase